MLQLSQAQTTLKQTEANMEKKIQKVRESYQEDIYTQQSIIMEATAKLKAFAEHNREELFTKKKSMETPHGRIGFRIGQWKVGYEKGFSKKALGLIQELKLPFIRTKEEIDKDKILTVREDEEQMKQLALCGIKVTQDETFFAEPKEETITA